MNPPYRSPSPMPQKSAKKESVEVRSFKQTTKFIMWTFFIYGVIPMFFVVPFLWWKARKDHITQEAAISWSVDHHGEFKGCETFGTFRACHVQTESGHLTLLYQPGNTFPTLINRNSQ